MSLHELAPESIPGMRASALASCGQRRAADRPLRSLALLLLLGLAARFGWELARDGFAFGPAAWSAGALGLGGCLWWVAQRQSGQVGAGLLLLFYVSSPAALRPGPPILAALGMFSMVYTAVGVAHALQGPPRKRPPRIALLTALAAFTATVDGTAAWTGLLLAALAAVYLAEGRRRVLLPLFLLWGLVIGIAASPSSDAGSFADTSAKLLFAPEGLALAAALAYWAYSRRSRYFGNSAPLLAAVLLLSASYRMEMKAQVWALPFALLFLAGVAADALEGPRGRLWGGYFWGLAAARVLEHFLVNGRL